MPRLLVIQHVPHERLGTFESAFTQAGCGLIILNADDPKIAWPRAEDLDGTVSMGGPMSVYRNVAAQHFFRRACTTPLNKIPLRGAGDVIRKESHACHC